VIGSHDICAALCEAGLDATMVQRSSTHIVRFDTLMTAHGVKLDNGKELPADVIVYATGHDSMNGWVADLCGSETADRMGEVWGLRSDTAKDPGSWQGEERNM
jgi:cation diffusion facilitator CzcD-associated flavoprotein CzcO